jgi:hypothetical protein
VTSLALTTAAPTVRSAVLFDVPTIKFPALNVEPVGGKVWVAEKELPLGRRETVPAVLTFSGLAPSA